MLSKVNLYKSSQNLNDKNVVVTGGAGFIGSWLTEILVRLGSRVTVIDDLSSGKLQNLKKVKSKIQFIKADISHPESFTKLKVCPDIIFHFAAIASVPDSVQNPWRTFEVNDIGTFNLLQWMRCVSGEPRLVFASSAAVYGEPIFLPITEEHPLNPISPYGASKLSGEGYCMAFNKTYGTKITILRLFNIYGPRQPRYVMYDFLKKILQEKREKLVVLGNGKQVRDFTFVTDAIKGILSAAVTEDAIGEIINIGSGNIICIANLAEKILQLLGLETIPLEFTQTSWKGDVTKFIADNSKARKLLDFNPKISIEEGLKEEIKWFKEDYL